MLPSAVEMGRQWSERMETWWLPHVARARVLLPTLSGRLLSLGGSDEIMDGLVCKVTLRERRLALVEAVMYPHFLS
jgi:hypothetical protein